MRNIFASAFEPEKQLEWQFDLFFKKIESASFLYAI
jgi:hypothetical protein